MCPKEQTSRSPGISQLPVMFRSRDLEAYGIPRDRLRTWFRRGDVIRLARGLYRIAGATATERETVAMVSARIPQAIICLHSALHLHGIGTQAPRQVWIALNGKTRKPKLQDIPVRVVRFSGIMQRYGVLTWDIQGVTVRVTSPARTIVDCFRYRNKIGIDIATEALQDAIRSGIATTGAIARAAEVCRARTVIRPYLEAMGQ